MNGKKKKSIKRPQIKIPAHLENTGMLDNKKNKISQEDEVQWSVAVQPSVGERLSSEILWYLDFFHLATQTNCMFKLLNGFLNCHAVCLKSDLMLRWMTPWKQKWALSVSSFNFPALIFSQFCGREKKQQKKHQLKQRGICLQQLIFRKAGTRLIMHLNALPSRTNRMYGGKNTGELSWLMSQIWMMHTLTHEHKACQSNRPQWRVY